jgi:hypothetical protein
MTGYTSPEKRDTTTTADVTRLRRALSRHANKFDCDYSGAIAQLRHAFLLSAMNAAKDRVVLFNSVTDNVRTTMRASRCEGLNRTFEAVKGVSLAV